MAKPARKSEKTRDSGNTRSRRGGSTFLGILIGLVLGLVIALGVAWYINRLPNPFKDKPAAPKSAQPYATTPAPKAAAPQPAQPPQSAEDKSKAAAEKNAKDTKPAGTEDKKSTAAGRETFFLQTGSFQSAPEAETLKARLALLGLEAAIQTRDLPEKGVWHRVRVGPYTDVDELNRVRDVLKQNNIEVALVKVREP